MTKKDKKEKTLKLPIKRIVSNNLFVLKMIFKSAPAITVTSLVITLMTSLMDFFSTAYILRYALNGINDGKSFGQIATFIAVLVVVQFVVYGLWQWYYRCYFEVRMVEVVKNVHNMVYTHAISVELECYENPKFHDDFVKAIDECCERLYKVNESVMQIVWFVTYLSTNFLLVVSIDPMFLLFVAIPLAVVPIQSKLNKIKYEKDMKLKEENRRKDYSRRTFYLSDYAKEMRLFGGQTGFPSLMLTRFRESGQRVIDIIKKYGLTIATLRYIIIECNEMLTTLGATMYAAWQTLYTGNIGYGDCIVIVNSIDGIAYTLTNFTGMLLSFHENALYIENLRKFLDYTPKITDGSKPLPQSGDIVLENVTFRYNDAKDGQDDGQKVVAKNVIDGVTMRFGANEKIAIVGHNGAGKTTLIKLLLRLYDIEDGNGVIRYGNENIKDLPVREYRNMFSAVMQDFHIFALTAAENVILGMRSDGDSKRICDALEKSGLGEKIKGFEKGIETLMTKEFDEKGEVLSGGEQQKLAISHVYSKSNRFVILDEPSSALDPIAEYEMYERMTSACKNCGMIFISHRLSSAVMADRIYLMEHGKVLETGTHAELMAKNGRYAEMFTKQAQNYAETEVTA